MLACEIGTGFGSVWPDSGRRLVRHGLGVLAGGEANGCSTQGFAGLLPSSIVGEPSPSSSSIASSTDCDEDERRPSMIQPVLWHGA